MASNPKSLTKEAILNNAPTTVEPEEVALHDELIIKTEEEVSVAKADCAYESMKFIKDLVGILGDSTSSQPTIKPEVKANHISIGATKVEKDASIDNKLTVESKEESKIDGKLMKKSKTTAGYESNTTVEYRKCKMCNQLFSSLALAKHELIHSKVAALLRLLNEKSVKLLRERKGNPVNWRKNPWLEVDKVKRKIEMWETKNPEKAVCEMAKTGLATNSFFSVFFS